MQEEPTRLANDSPAYAEELRRFNRKFAALVVALLVPFSAVPVLVSSGDWNEWYQQGVGWPLRYGWRTLCIRPNVFRITVDRSLSMWTDIFLALALLLTAVWLVRRIERP